MNPRLSLVVPAYNENELLPRLLGTIDLARRSYRGGGDAIEVIVADNGSTDETGCDRARPAAASRQSPNAASRLLNMCLNMCQTPPPGRHLRPFGRVSVEFRASPGSKR